jgi:hypothetical protein
MVWQGWLLGELMRLGVLKGTAQTKAAAWSPSGSLDSTLVLLGLEVDRLDPRFSEKVQRYLASLLGPDRDPSFFGCYERALLSRHFSDMLDQACATHSLRAPSEEDRQDLGDGRLGDLPADRRPYAWSSQ